MCHAFVRRRPAAVFEACLLCCCTFRRTFRVSSPWTLLRVCVMACRCYLQWQLPWHPKDVPLQTGGPGPWLRMFQNARQWLKKESVST